MHIFRIAGEHFDIVVEPDPARRSEQIIFGKRQIKGYGHRHQRKAEKADNERTDKGVARQILAQPLAQRFLRSAGVWTCGNRIA
ncbi:hypothetical protein D3C74_417790 [compost metagenome]